MQLTASEEAVIEELVLAGESYPNAAVAVLMATRDHSRRQQQLIEVALCGYPGLEDKSIIAAAVHHLLNIHWLQRSRRGAEGLIAAATDLPSKIAERAGDPSIVDKLRVARDQQEQYVRLLGGMTHPEAERAFRLAVAGSQSTIKLPMLGTPPTFEGVNDLLARAAAGVEILVLLASPTLVSELRGPSAHKRASLSIAGWRDLARQHSHLHIRITHRRQAMLTAASASFDGVKAQLAVYDPYAERSQSSQVIQAYKRGAIVNLTELVDDHFDREWSRARPIGVLGVLLWYCREYRWEAFFALALIVLLRSQDARVQNVAGGIAVVCLIQVLAHLGSIAGGSLAWIMRRIRRLRAVSGPDDAK